MLNLLGKENKAHSEKAYSDPADSITIGFALFPLFPDSKALFIGVRIA